MPVSAAAAALLGRGAWPPWAELLLGFGGVKTRYSLELIGSQALTRRRWFWSET